MNCKCDSLFKDFKWRPLNSISLNKIQPETRVYAIRYDKKGLDIDQTILKTRDFFGQAQWESVNSYIFNRLNRLKSIQDCPIIYIGSAPSIKAGGLKSRYKDLSGRRHTVFYPVLALLIAGWALQWGILPTKGPKAIEKEIVRNYNEIHGANPALLKRV